MGKESETGVINVEELCRFIEELNKKLKERKPKQITCKKPPKIPNLKSEIKLRDLDVKLVAKLVGITIDRETILENNIEDGIQTPTTKTTFNSFSNPNKVAKLCNQENQFNPPNRDPT